MIACLSLCTKKPRRHILIFFRIRIARSGGSPCLFNMFFADLSAALAKLIKATGVPPSYPAQVQQLHCPMYRSDEGGSIWLQPKGSVRNPFYGSMMLTCFDERTVLPVTGRSKPTE